MARPRKDGVSSTPPPPPALLNWAEAFGDAIGRGVVRALNEGLANLPLVSNGQGGGNGHGGAARRRGRPPKAAASGAVPAERRCTVSGCGREARSKGLCSAHYQAERRRQLSPGKPA